MRGNMKENFESCLEKILKHEGGFVNHPEDPGGMTNMGITKKVYERFLGKEVNEQEMRDMPKEHVAEIYRKNYWERVKADDLPSGLDLCVFDWAVNSGTKRAVCALQESIGAEVDGVMGPMTIGKVKVYDNLELLKVMKEKRENFYRSLTHLFKTFGTGWLRRNNETYETSKDYAKSRSQEGFF